VLAANQAFLLTMTAGSIAGTPLGDLLLGAAPDTILIPSRSPCS
jgi:hypothetical protein